MRLCIVLDDSLGFEDIWPDGVEGRRPDAVEKRRDACLLGGATDARRLKPVENLRFADEPFAPPPMNILYV